ncbi:hypothetical protein [Dactylosporangium sp. CA-233914]|uniref:hypothetical protein n=1 Tax=Dactylosporangium sp. CA-233914 TaxID=3239934 RepID=UPI003D8D66CF
MPHLYTVLQRLARPELTGGRPIWRVVLDACLFILGLCVAANGTRHRTSARARSAACDRLGSSPRAPLEVVDS